MDTKSLEEAWDNSSLLQRMLTVRNLSLGGGSSSSKNNKSRGDPDEIVIRSIKVLIDPNDPAKGHRWREIDPKTGEPRVWEWELDDEEERASR